MNSPVAKSMRLQEWLRELPVGLTSNAVEFSQRGRPRGISWADTSGSRLEQVKTVSPLPQSAYLVSPTVMSPTSSSAPTHASSVSDENSPLHNASVDGRSGTKAALFAFNVGQKPIVESRVGDLRAEHQVSMPGPPENYTSRADPDALFRAVEKFVHQHTSKTTMPSATVHNSYEGMFSSKVVAPTVAPLPMPPAAASPPPAPAQQPSNSAVRKHNTSLNTSSTLSNSSIITTKMPSEAPKQAVMKVNHSGARPNSASPDTRKMSQSYTTLHKQRSESVIRTRVSTSSPRTSIVAAKKVVEPMARTARVPAAVSVMPNRHAKWKSGGATTSAATNTTSISLVPPKSDLLKVLEAGGGVKIGSVYPPQLPDVSSHWTPHDDTFHSNTSHTNTLHTDTSNWMYTAQSRPVLFVPVRPLGAAAVEPSNRTPISPQDSIREFLRSSSPETAARQLLADITNMNDTMLGTHVAPQSQAYPHAGMLVAQATKAPSPASIITPAGRHDRRRAPEIRSKTPSPVKMTQLKKEISAASAVLVHGGHMTADKQSSRSGITSQARSASANAVSNRSFSSLIETKLLHKAQQTTVPDITQLYPHLKALGPGHRLMTDGPAASRYNDTAVENPDVAAAKRNIRTLQSKLTTPSTNAVSSRKASQLPSRPAQNRVPAQSKKASTNFSNSRAAPTQSKQLNASILRKPSTVNKATSIAVATPTRRSVTASRLESASRDPMTPATKFVRRLVDSLLMK